jgi:hypothetical protein
MSAGPIVLVLLAVVIVTSGVMLTRSGRPLSGVLLNIHKLVDLALLAGIGVVVFRDAQVAPLSRVAILATVLVAAAQFLGLVSGGVTSAWTSAPHWVVWSHRILSWVALAVTIWWAVLFLF